MKKGYIDLFLLPVPKKHLRTYCEISRRMGKVMREYGALEYREFLGTDLTYKGMVSFSKRVTVKKGEVVVAAAVGFRSKADRERINKKMKVDPRVLKLITEMNKNPFLSMKRMSYGGFETIVNV
jgi:uncharacterized protein YbaA (DUF1428 family)